jgi:hypothetical protein
MKILPGLSKVRGEWNLVCLAIDLRPRPEGLASRRCSPHNNPAGQLSSAHD